MAPRKNKKRMPSVRKLLKTSSLKIQNKLKERAFRQRSADKQQRKQQRRLRQALRAVRPEQAEEAAAGGGGGGGGGGAGPYGQNGNATATMQRRRRWNPADEDPHHPDHRDEADDDDDDDDDDDLPLDMMEEEDLKLIRTAANNSAFLSARLEASPCASKRRRKSRRDDDDADDDAGGGGGGGGGAGVVGVGAGVGSLEEMYARAMLRADRGDAGGAGETRLVKLLPLKTEKGEIIRRSEVRPVPSSDRDDSDEDEQDEQEDVEDVEEDVEAAPPGGGERPGEGCCGHGGDGAGGGEELLMLVVVGGDGGDGGGGGGVAGLAPASGEELRLRRARLLAETKRRMARLASRVLAEPHGSLKELRELRSMLHEKRCGVAGTVRKLAMLSLLEVFLDVVPGYRIRPLSAAEKDTKVKKEVQQLREFEEGLVQQYRCYLDTLEQTVKDWKLMRLKRVEAVSLASYWGLAQVALRCLCRLLVSLRHFNFHRNVALAVTPLTTDSNTRVASECCEAVAELFRVDRVGDASLSVVKIISALIRSRNYNVRPEALRTLLQLRIHEAEVRRDSEPAGGKRRQGAAGAGARRGAAGVSRMQRKWRKAAEILEKELMEADATEGRERKSKLQVDILDTLFTLYFRILKKSGDSTPLLSPVLEGLSKFSHLISVDFFDDLLIVLHRLTESSNMKYRDSLHCIITAFNILSGQGDVLNIDPSRFYSHLYSTLYRIPTGSSCDVRLLLSCVDTALLRRRRQVAQSVAQAFGKRLATLGLHLGPHGALGALTSTRALLLAFPASAVLLDSDSGGSGCYLPLAEHPEQCRAHRTALWELHLLAGHYHPAVSQVALHLLQGVPMEGRGSLPHSLTRRTPVELFDDFNPGRMTFNPPVQSTAPSRKTLTKKIFTAAVVTTSSLLSKEVEQEEEEEDEVMDFWSAVVFPEPVLLPS
ncbi:nucleolar complex protein 3 homolog [Petromyzon marinus]|uniref:nucleolar complex protein 3 homolog n=1 Tax=Petromyzon marinus TaxID=7757 RepID=UPI003F702C10